MESRRVKVILKKPRQVKGNHGKLKQEKCSQGVDGLREIKWIQKETRKESILQTSFLIKRKRGMQRNPCYSL